MVVHPFNTCTWVAAVEFATSLVNTEFKDRQGYTGLVSKKKIVRPSNFDVPTIQATKATEVPDVF